MSTSVWCSTALCIFLCSTPSLHFLPFVRRLLEANGTLNSEIGRLKEVVDEKERDLERVKVNKCRVEEQRSTNQGRRRRVGHKQVCFHFYNCLQAQIRDRDIGEDRNMWVIYIIVFCVCVREEHTSACVCVHWAADQIWAFTSNKSVGRHVSLFHTQSILNKADDDDDNSRTGKLWMKHPMGLGHLCVLVRVCVCACYGSSSIWMCYSCWAFNNDYTPIKCRSSPACHPMAVK